VTFKDLQKLVHSQGNTEQNQLLESLRSKSFWIWDQAANTPFTDPGCIMVIASTVGNVLREMYTV